MRNLPGSEFNLHRVITRETLISTPIHAGDATVQSIERIASAIVRHNASTALVQVVKRIQLVTLGPNVADRGDKPSTDEVMLKGGIPLLRVRRDHVFIQHPGGASIGKGTSTQDIAKSVELVGKHQPTRSLNHRVSGRVLDDVKQRVSKVGVVEHAIAGTEHSAGVAGYIPS